MWLNQFWWTMTSARSFSNIQNRLMKLRNRWMIRRQRKLNMKKVKKNALFILLFTRLLLCLKETPLWILQRLTLTQNSLRCILRDRRVLVRRKKESRRLGSVAGQSLQLSVLKVETDKPLQPPIFLRLENNLLKVGRPSRQPSPFVHQAKQTKSVKICAYLYCWLTSESVIARNASQFMKVTRPRLLLANSASDMVITNFYVNVYRTWFTEHSCPFEGGDRKIDRADNTITSTYFQQEKAMSEV